MRDVILISQGRSLQNLDVTLDEQPDGFFSINYLRVKSQESINHLIQKKPLKELPDGEIIEKGEIKNNKGQIGSLAIETEEEAIALAKKELNDTNSEVYSKGFGKDTIFIVADLDKDIARIVNWK